MKAPTYSEYIKCDCCGCKRSPFNSKYDTVNGMTICAKCLPRYEGESKENGHVPNLVDAESKWEENEKE